MRAGMAPTAAVVCFGHACPTCAMSELHNWHTGISVWQRGVARNDTAMQTEAALRTSAIPQQYGPPHRLLTDRHHSKYRS